MRISKKFDTEREAADFRRILQGYCPETRPRVKGIEVFYEKEFFDYEKCKNSLKVFGLDIKL